MRTKEIESTQTLWEEISKAANFKADVYDRAFLAEIKNKLNINNRSSIPNQLKRKSISSEELIAALLQTMEPFSNMMTDLLQMFESAGAQASDNNLLVKFDFKKAKDSFSLDLDQFKRQIEKVQMVRSWISVLAINAPWEMIHILKNAVAEAYNYNFLDLPDDIAKWMFEYREKDTWPKFFPQQPKSNIENIDKRIFTLWKALKYSVQIYMEAFDAGKGKRQSHLEECQRRNNDNLWWAETDFWVGQFMEILGELAVATRILCNGKRMPEVQTLQNALDKCTLLMDEKKKEETLPVTDILEMLNLPIWEKRYELYSAWVSTQIVKALEEWGVHFNVVDSAISFSFGGSHIASCYKLCPPLHVWAELRTEYKNPLSRKRKNHIQPDYTLAIDNVFEPENSVAVIECKQYKRYNVKNFTEAAIDYTNGRPNADVLLVNYTDIPQRIRGKIPANLLSRIPYFKRLYPIGGDLSEFRETLKASVERYYDSHFPIADHKSLLQIKLSWNSLPRDLDLYLRVSEISGKQHWIYFRNRGDEAIEPFAVLDMDCMDGFGLETIRVNRLIDGIYDVFVHNYSGEAVVNGEIEVSIITRNDTYKVTRKNAIPAEYFWHVFSIKAEKVEAVDAIEKKSFLLI